MKDHQLNDWSGTKSIRASSPCVTHSATARLLKCSVKQFCSDFKFGHLCFRWHHKLMSSDFLRWLSQFINSLEVHQSQVRNILEVHQLLTTILTVLLMLLLMKEQNQNSQRVNSKQNQKKIFCLQICYQRIDNLFVIIAVMKPKDFSKLNSNENFTMSF